jgi:hypothetical protein
MNSRRVVEGGRFAIFVEVLIELRLFSISSCAMRTAAAQHRHKAICIELSTAIVLRADEIE